MLVTASKVHHARGKGWGSGDREGWGGRAHGKKSTSKRAAMWRTRGGRQIRGKETVRTLLSKNQRPKAVAAGWRGRAGKMPYPCSRSK